MTRSSGITSDFGGTLVSRRLDGSARRTTPIPLPPPAGVQLPSGLTWHVFLGPPGIAIVGDRLIVNALWTASDGDRFSGSHISSRPLVATFQLTTGALLGTLRADDRDASTVPGTDIATIGRTDPPYDTQHLSLADPPLPIPDPLPAAGAGRFDVTFDGASPHGTGSGSTASPSSWARAAVRARATGRIVYRVTSRTLSRAAVPAHEDGTVQVDRLFPDGGLAITARRNGTIDGRLRPGVRPVAVDGRGNVRRLGSLLPHATSASALLSGGRGLVGAEADLPRPQCRGLWLVNPRGTRGRAVFRPSLARTFPPRAWTGDAVVWNRATPPADVRTFSGHRYLTVDNGIRRIALSRAQRPTC